MRAPLYLFFAGLISVSVVALAPSIALAKQTKPQKRDLADVVAGTYAGPVVADVRGPSGAQVSVVVRRIGKNLVEITSDHERIPAARIGLIRTSGAIMFGRGYSGFLIEDKDRRRLDLTIDGVTMILRKV